MVGTHITTLRAGSLICAGGRLGRGTVESVAGGLWVLSNVVIPLALGGCDGEVCQQFSKLLECQNVTICHGCQE